MLVLGIETSCDETGVALYDSERGLVADVLYSQVRMHAEYGGVVPELASRDHIRKTIPLIRVVLRRGGATPADLDGVAYTAGPGLIGALMVGATIGRSLAWSLGVPAIGVHHMEGHLLAPLMNPEPPAVPFIALLVSGGHTQLVQVDQIGSYEILGESIDDAAGEAFDKTAKLLGLGYPGGPALAAQAEHGDPGRFRFPRPMTDRPGLDFSFSGLKTHALMAIRKLEAGSAAAGGAGGSRGAGSVRSVGSADGAADVGGTTGARDAGNTGSLSDKDRADVCRAFEEAVVDTLTIKCRRALEQTGIDQLVIAGGVAANKRLRAALAEQLNARVFYAPPALCTDNGAMIAYAGYQRLAAGQHEPLHIATRARWPMNELPPLDAQKPTA